MIGYEWIWFVNLGHQVEEFAAICLHHTVIPAPKLGRLVSPSIEVVKVQKASAAAADTVSSLRSVSLADFSFSFDLLLLYVTVVSFDHAA